MPGHGLSYEGLCRPDNLATLTVQPNKKLCILSAGITKLQPHRCRFLRKACGDIEQRIARSQTIAGFAIRLGQIDQAAVWQVQIACKLAASWVISRGSATGKARQARTNSHGGTRVTRCSRQFVQPIVVGHFVVIYKRHPSATRLGKPSVTQGRHVADGIGHIADGDRGAGCHGLDDFPATLRGVIIDNDDFAVLTRPVLLTHAGG